MDEICNFCGAKHWLNEGTGNSYNVCCGRGKVRLGAPRKPPTLLQKLWTENTQEAKVRNSYKRNFCVLSIFDNYRASSIRFSVFLLSKSTNMFLFLEGVLLGSKSKVRFTIVWALFYLLRAESRFLRRCTSTIQNTSKSNFSLLSS